MTIKSKNIDKFSIEQFIISKQTFEDWLDGHYTELTKKSAIIGYMFSHGKGKFGVNVDTLNLYLINRRYYSETGVTREVLEQSANAFFCSTEKVFKNPPISQWFDTKINWCKKLAKKYCVRFNKTYDDMLSDIYYTILRLYKKPNVYMGSLNYIERSIVTDQLLEKRDDKNKSFNDVAKSLDSPIPCEDDNLSLEDVIASDFDMDKDIEYNELVRDTKKLLSNMFSEREIEMLLNTPTNMLMSNLYRRLLNWRKHHNSKEVL